MIRWRSILVLAAAISGGRMESAEPAPTDLPMTELNPFTVRATLGLHEEPALGLATPVTQLRFALGVDLQSRGYAELQSDVTVRGSTFEQTGVLVGTVPLFDPQTGHYAAELPFSGEMLRPPRLLQGTENATLGFNANVASLAFAWAPIETRGKAVFGAGSDALIFGELYQGQRLDKGAWAFDFSLGHGQGEGTVDNGDFEVWRGAARVQRRTDDAQTDLAVGWLDKFYGWPGLYTGFASLPETDDYQNLVVLLNHRTGFGSESSWSLGGAFRQMEDDYYFNRTTPPAERTSLFQHLTRAVTIAGDLHWVLSENWTGKGRAVFLQDELVRSTSLVNGDPATDNDFTERRYAKAVLGAELNWGGVSAGEHRLEVGLAATTTDQDTGRWSPLLGWERRSPGFGGDLTLFAQYAETSQVPGYTALRSAPAGLFGGNPNLGRELSRVGEVGFSWDTSAWHVQGAFFVREDDALVDWTFAASAPTARQANPLGLETLGTEIQIVRQGNWGEIRLGYARLEKDADYADALVDASYYVLNFPRHRLTAGARWRLQAGLECGAEAEYRIAEKNARRRSDDEALLVSLALRWQPWTERGFELNFLLDNVLDEDFEEFPGSPAVGRHGSLRALYRW
jgi:vitamin B12 transporter